MMTEVSISIELKKTTSFEELPVGVWFTQAGKLYLKIEQIHVEDEVTWHNYNAVNIQDGMLTFIRYESLTVQVNRVSIKAERFQT